MTDETFDIPHFAPADGACREMTAGFGRGAIEIALAALDGAQRAATLEMLLCHELAVGHCAMMQAATEARDFYVRRRRTGFFEVEEQRASLESARHGNLSARLFDRVVRAALALQRLGGGPKGGVHVWSWARPDWLDAFPEMTPANLAKANAAQKAADERRRREAEEQARRKWESENPKLHAAPGLRRGQLKNGNPAGDYLAAPRCGAATRAGGCCRQPAMANGRCRMHGGCSTGPRTAEGQARARAARFVHGYRTAEIIDFRAAAARSARRLATLAKLARKAAPTGQGVHRSVSPSSLGERMNHRDTEAQGERVNAAQSAAPRSKDVSRAAEACPRAADPGGRASNPLGHNLASLARSARSLCASAPLWFNLRSRRAAGHGVHRSVSSSPLGRRAAAG
jgi:hypothetical protein